MALVIVGVTYWNWLGVCQIRMKQMLLESAVLELRGMLVSSQRSSEPTTVSEPCSISAFVDETDWEPESTEISKIGGCINLETADVEPFQDEAPDVPEAQVDVPDIPDVPEAQVEIPDVPDAHDDAPPVAAPEDTVGEEVATQSTSGTIDNMPVKELRRLAEKRGIQNSSEMKKKELLSALRKQSSRDRDRDTVPAAEDGILEVELFDE